MNHLTSLNINFCNALVDCAIRKHAENRATARYFKSLYIVFTVKTFHYNCENDSMTLLSSSWTLHFEPGGDIRFGAKPWVVLPLNPALIRNILRGR